MTPPKKKIETPKAPAVDINKMLPKEVDAVFMAFPATLGDMLPSYFMLPEEFRQERHEMVKVASTWFHLGLNKKAAFIPKPGIDPKKAMIHLNCCMRSFEPKHEHKLAGVGWLLHLWFERIENWKP